MGFLCGLPLRVGGVGHLPLRHEGDERRHPKSSGRGHAQDYGDDDPESFLRSHDGGDGHLSRAILFGHDRDGGEFRECSVAHLDGVNRGYNGSESWYHVYGLDHCDRGQIQSFKDRLAHNWSGLAHDFREQAEGEKLG